MEGGVPWSMPKCAGGVQDKTIINRIMFGFRPIAPKPVAGDSVSRESMFGNKNLVVTSKRAKRKYVRVCKRNNRRRRLILDEAKEDNDGNKSFVTLQLIPEKADLEKSMVGERSWGVVDDLDRMVGNNSYRFQESPSLCSKLKKMVADDVAVMGSSDQTSLITSPEKRTTVVESWVTVENVTDTWIEEGEMGNYTDSEKMNYLEKDTYPGFISDALNRVYWVNQAFINMVGVDGEQVETAVGLAVKDGFMFAHGAFSCRIRLQYGDGAGQKKHSTMVPCDAWKMSCGGFAWRLDVKAALSLGL